MQWALSTLFLQQHHQLIEKILKIRIIQQSNEVLSFCSGNVQAEVSCSLESVT